MKNTGETGNYKPNCRADCPSGQALGRGIWSKFIKCNRIFNARGDFFIDRWDFIDDTGHGRDGNVRPAGNIGDADSFWSVAQSALNI